MITYPTVTFDEILDFNTYYGVKKQMVQFNLDPGRRLVVHRL